jgi:hypothetical protein
VTGLRGAKPATLRLDLPVDVILERVRDDVVLPYVRPRETAGA